MLLLFCALAWLNLWASRRLYRDYATPVGIYTLVWSLLIGLYHADLVAYDPVSPTTWYAVYGAAAAFMVGGWTVLLWGLRPTPERPRHLPIRPVRFDIPAAAYRRLLWGMSLLGLVGFCFQLDHLTRTIGWDVFFGDPAVARELHSNVKYWGYLNILNVAGMVLAAMYTAAYRRLSLVVPVIAVIAVASALVTTDRTRFFYMVIWTLFAVLYTTGGARMTGIKSAAAAGTAGLLLLFFVVVGSVYERTYSDRFAAYLHFAPPYTALAEPYIYLTGSIPALDALMKDENPLHGGKFSFSPLVKLWSLVDPDVETVPLKGKLYHVPMELNTYSYLQQFFQDWGWWGILLGPYVCGLLSCACYLRMRRAPDLASVYLAALVAYCCTISIFVNMFTQEATWFFALAGLGAARLVGGSVNGSDRSRSKLHPASAEAV